MANGKGTIEIQIASDEPKPKIIQFIRLSKKSDAFYDSWRQRTYICRTCGAIIVSKVDHTRFHQDMIDMMIAIAYKTIPLNEAQQIRFQPTEINPLRKPSF